MDYQETVQWMFQQLPMYQKDGKKAYKNNLNNILNFSNYLKNPEKSFKSIHIAGTNGKGSTASMVASILKENGFKVGLYTSPHLKDYRERIVLNGHPIEEEFVVDFISTNKTFLESNHLSFFEMSVGLAFEYFKKENIDFAVIEVGLGGRLDATNIISPLVSVITSIGFDHQEFLGDTLEKIATEKAGIIKPNTPVVIGETKKETLPVFIEHAKINHSPLILSEKEVFKKYTSDLTGDYQIQNIQTARTVIQVLINEYDYKITEENIEKGFLRVKENSGLKGRWDILESKPFIVADCAHNEHGLRFTLAQLKKMSFKKIHFIIGFVNDKDLKEILCLFPKDASYYFVQPNNSRGLDADILKEKAAFFNLFGNSYGSVNEALIDARKNTSIHDCIYVGGSTFIVADLY